MSISSATPLPLIELLENGVLAWALLACGTAQISKLVVELVVRRRWRPAVLVETGGMPSSHSALMSAAAAGVGWQLGFGDPLFALAAAAAIVVMYDASGVRRAASRISQRVNALPVELWPGDDREGPLTENLGHSRLEVLVGGSVGPAVALSGLALVGSPWQLAQRIGWVSIS